MNRRRLSWPVVGLGLVVGIGLAVGVYGWSRTPAEVADHAAPFVATFDMAFRHPTLVGQSFQTRWDQLSRIDVILAADPDGPSPSGQLTFHLRPDLPGVDIRQVGDLRTVVVEAGMLGLPRQPILELRPGQPSERWTSFRFDPIPDSGGQRYVWLLDYQPGPAAESLHLLTHFHNQYPQGNLFLDGAFLNANALFRLAFRGTQMDHLWVVRDNLLRQVPAALGSRSVFYGSIGLLAALAVAALAALWPSWPRPLR